MEKSAPLLPKKDEKSSKYDGDVFDVKVCVIDLDEITNCLDNAARVRDAEEAQAISDFRRCREKCRNHHDGCVTACLGALLGGPKAALACLGLCATYI